MKHLDGHYRVKHLVYLAIMASEGGAGRVSRCVLYYLRVSGLVL